MLFRSSHATILPYAVVLVVATHYQRSAHGSGSLLPRLVPVIALGTLAAHTTNPVPFLVCSKGKCDGQHLAPPLAELADIAPYILTRMDLPVPDTMK